MLLGLGRGPPGRGPPGRARSPGPGRPAGRGPPGRGPPGAVVPGAAGPGPVGPAGAAARGAAPMPVAVELNGLLPGRGPGRGPGRWPGAAGRGPEAAGRGAAGRASGSPPGRCCVGMVSAGGSCGPTLWSCGNGTVIAGPGRAGAGGATGAGGSATGGPAAAGAPAAAPPSATASPGSAVGAAVTRPLAARRPVAAGFGPAPFPDPAWPANASLSRRTTGASIVEDADRTNSPISWSLAMTALLSTPNSFASSYTRTFATTLPLLGPEIPDLPAGRGSACSVRRQLVLFIAACSSGAHCNLSLLSPVPPAVGTASSRIPASYVMLVTGRTLGSPNLTSGIPRPSRPAVWPASEGPARMPCGAGLVPSMPGADASTHLGPAAARQHRELSRPRQPPRGSTQSWPRVHHTLCRYGSVQPVRLPAYRAGCSSGAAWSSGCARFSAVSGRISIRQPVRRAASRAFCPSLPMASDSW